MGEKLTPTKLAEIRERDGDDRRHGYYVQSVFHDRRKLLLVRFDAFLDATGDAPVPYFEDELEIEPKEPT